MDLEQLERNGFTLVPEVFGAIEMRHINALFDSELGEGKVKRRGGVRDVLNHLEDLRDMAEHISILNLVCQVLGDEVFLARATLFNKTAEANWKVPWHQDVTIAVKEKQDAPGYSPWSMKESVPHVQPPSEVLERMLTVRVHIDPCPESNGALWVQPGSPRLGRLNQNDVASHVNADRAVCCSANAGDAVVMRPLLFHRSSASSLPTRRRVLHFDYAIGDLASGLQWHMRDYARPTLFHEPSAN
jgi:ectoine hydroxylase-related dioxygenase (phytanoyl-CoA dioxygenase family)